MPFTIRLFLKKVYNSNVMYLMVYVDENEMYVYFNFNVKI